MITQKEFLEELVKKLEQSNVPYMFSGSVVSSNLGKPRATNDADIVVDPSSDNLLGFLDSLGPDYYVSRDAAIEALNNYSMFNIIHIESGYKADFIIRKNRSFSNEEFSRRRPAKIMGVDLLAVSPEDSILSKLEWAKESQSQMQFDDAFKVLYVQWNSLDFEYLKKWAKELNVEDALEQLLKEVEKLK